MFSFVSFRNNSSELECIFEVYEKCSGDPGLIEVPFNLEQAKKAKVMCPDYNNGKLLVSDLFVLLHRLSIVVCFILYFFWFFFWTQECICFASSICYHVQSNLC